MCGIAGVVGHAQALEWTERIARAQQHRGPDSGGVLRLRADVAFGHRRLAIVDLSERGHQPMTSRDGRWTITLNGEIFNYAGLRAELTGVEWRSETDTEVLLEAIAAWGLERALDRTVGMFAFGLWDRVADTLVLARDRAGEKPLVYFWNGTTLAFASEMKALTGLHNSAIAPEALDVYLGLGYIPAPLGIFRNTHKLQAGHYACLRRGVLDVRRWWFPERREDQRAEEPERREQLRRKVGEAVRTRLHADVPVALALSGGVDSSAIAVEMQRSGAAPETFTVAFGEDDSDVAHAGEVAQHLGLRHAVIQAKAPGPEDLSLFAESYDEPFADSSALGCMALASAVSGRYKVILDGDGGDEAFGGYRHYEYIAPKQWVKAAAAAVGLRDGQRSSSVYVQSKTTFRAGERALLLNGHGAAGLDQFLATDAFLHQSPAGSLKQALWSDRHLALANGLTYKMDVALAARGIEGRAPFLDHRVLEWSQALDERDLVRGRGKKILLREAYAGELPASVLKRAKQGFGAPIGTWLAGPMREELAQLLPCPLLEAELQRGLSGQRLWTVFALACWARKWGASW